MFREAMEVLFAIVVLSLPLAVIGSLLYAVARRLVSGPRRKAFARGAPAAPGAAPTRA